VIALRWIDLLLPRLQVDLTKCDMDLMDLHVIDLERAALANLCHQQHSCCG
jgi:hypothetical protein